MRKTKEDYPYPARDIDYNEVKGYVLQLAQKAKDFNVTQIIGVSRSGLPFATWVAQILNLELGTFNPKTNKLNVYEDGNFYNQRYFVIDETSERGNTKKLIDTALKLHIARKDLYFINAEYQFATVFIDHFHPNKANSIYIKELDFWANGIAGVMKYISPEELHWRDQ